MRHEKRSAYTGASERVGDMGEYEELWQTFCDSISIEARRNEKLQKQMLALHFRSNMPEFSVKG